MAYKTLDEISKELKSLTDHLAKQSKSADESWKDIADSVEKSSKSLQSGWIGAISQLFGAKSAITSVSTTMAQGFRGSSEYVDALYNKSTELRKELAKLHSPFAARQSAEYNRVRREADAAYKAAEAHAKLSRTVGDTMRGSTGAASAILATSLAIALKYSKEINESLIDANANYAVRARLASQISHVQAITGNEMADMAKAAKSLTAYGFDLRDGFQDTLKTVVMMEEGLGVSYDTSAKLAVVTKRIGGNFTDISNSLARIKADTALTADEAARFATQIGKAITLLKPGSGGLLSQTTEYISRVAAALKELTGDGSKFVDMLASFTTEAGMMGAATLGATPDFLASPEKTKQVTENFVRYVNRQLSGTSGFQRMATIQLLADQFNTSAEVIANAEEMLKKYNETQRGTTSLQEQWRQQTSELAKTFSKIVNSIRAVVQETLLPLINNYLRPALGAVADALQWVAKHSWAAKVAGVALGAMALYAAVAFTRLAFAITRAAVASAGYESLLSKGGGIGSIFTKGGAKDFAKFMRTDLFTGKAVPMSRASFVTRGVSNAITTWLPRIGTVLSRLLGFITGPLLAISAAAIGGWMAGRMIDKGLKKMGVDLSELVRSTKPDQFRSAMLSLGRGSMTREDMLRQVGAMAGSGADAEAIQAYIMRNINKLRGMHVTDASGREVQDAAWRAKIVEGILGDVGGEITRQRARLGYTTLTTQSSEDKARDERMIQIFKDIAMNTAFTGKVTDQVERRTRLNEEFSKRERDEQEAEERLKRQRMEDIQDAMRRAGASGWGPKF